jgi:hypothetical protein
MRRKGSLVEQIVPILKQGRVWSGADLICQVETSEQAFCH